MNRTRELHLNRPNAFGCQIHAFSNRFKKSKGIDLQLPKPCLIGISLIGQPMALCAVGVFGRHFRMQIRHPKFVLAFIAIDIAQHKSKMRAVHCTYFKRTIAFIRVNRERIIRRPEQFLKFLLGALRKSKIVMRIDVACGSKVYFIELKCKMTLLFCPYFSTKQTKTPARFAKIIIYLYGYSDSVTFSEKTWRQLRSEIFLWYTDQKRFGRYLKTVLVYRIQA